MDGRARARTIDFLSAIERLVFLVADADDWPQRLYRDIGFRDAGLLYRFMRNAA